MTADLRPTGVLAISDAMVIGMLRSARELGRRVPEDISIVERRDPCPEHLRLETRLIVRGSDSAEPRRRPGVGSGP